MPRRTAWDEETLREFKTKTYATIDPETVNPEDYARDMRGEQDLYGEVREVSTAKNAKHPENDLTIDWLMRRGTRFTTDAEGLPPDQEWTVEDLPYRDPNRVWMVPVRNNRSDSGVQSHYSVSFVNLGVVQDETGTFRQVRSKLTHKPTVGAENRIRLNKL